MRIALGVCGGIAAYKAAELTRLLQRDGFDVEVIMTEGAQEFVRPLTFAALTGHRVITGLWNGDPAHDAGAEHEAEATGAMEHISVGQRISALVVAPATADTIAKFASGLASDILSTTYLATSVAVILAPAMNVNMWNHPATQANVRTLRARGVHIVEPGDGYLACGMLGGGRMAEPAEIAAAVRDVLIRGRDFEGETVVVTAGGTREPIDPVRYLGNRSSGKMGFALARQAAVRGARVILIAAPTSLETPQGCERVDVTTAGEMRDAVMAYLPEATIVIKAAAVSDFRVSNPSERKIKRNGTLTLELEPTEDILAEVVSRRREGTFVLGFAAETEDAMGQARQKMKRKGVDAIVVNDVSEPGLGFDSDRNAVTLLTAEEAMDFAAMPKPELAGHLLQQVSRLRRVGRSVIL